jgi:hypothetical protein
VGHRRLARAGASLIAMSYENAAVREFSDGQITKRERPITMAELVFGPQCDSPPSVWRAVMMDASTPPNVKRCRVVAVTAESALRRVERALVGTGFSVTSIEAVK